MPFIIFGLNGRLRKCWNSLKLFCTKNVIHTCRAACCDKTKEKQGDQHQDVEYDNNVRSKSSSGHTEENV